MLAYIRKKADSVVVWLIIGAIALVFVFFGMGGSGGETGFIVVNGEKADGEEFQELVREAGARLAENSEDEAADSGSLSRQAAAAELVNRLLIRQFAEAAGLLPSREATMKAVAAAPAFQVEGRFDMERYLTILKSQGRDPGSFERELRRSLASEKAVGLVMGLARPGRPELTELFHLQGDRLRFDYFFLAAEDGVPETPALDEEKIAAYYAANQSRWRRPEEMTAQYVEIIPADFTAQVELSEAELEEYYQEETDRFQRPEAVLTSQIVFPFSSLDPSEEEKKVTLAQAEAAMERLRRGADFAGLAREINGAGPGTPGDSGGDMGFVGRGDTWSSFEELIFSAPLDQPVGPVLTPAGYHLALVREKRPAGPRPLAEVRDELAGELKLIRARAKAVRLLEDLLSRAELNPDLEEAARSLGLRAALSRPFTPDNPPAFFEGDSRAARRAFSAALDRPGPLLEGERTLVLYVPRSRQASRIPPLEEIRAEVEQAWTDGEKDRLTGELLESRRPLIQSQGWEAYYAGRPQGDPLKSGSGPLSSRFGQTSAPPFDRSDPQAVAALVFPAVRPGEILPSSLAGSLDDRPGRFLLRLAEFQPAEESGLDGPEGRTLQNMLGFNKANQLFQLWRLSLYEASKNGIIVPSRAVE